MGRGKTRPFFLMKNIQSYIVGAILVAFATLPYVNIKVMAPGEYFPWLFFLVGVAGMYLMFLKINAFVKAAALLGLFNAFLSSAPLVSFLAYFSLIAACYFYYLCTRINNFEIVFKMLQALLFFNAFMFLMQAIGHDPLMNFQESIYFGTVGQHMQSASFTVILAAVLVQHNPGNLFFPFITSMICNSAGAFISAASGLIPLCYKKFNRSFVIQLAIVLALVFSLWMAISGKFIENISLGGGRLGVWLATVKLGQQNLWFGWGMGTYQYIFPAIGGINTIPWKTTHNCWLQIFFEMGLTGLALVIGYAAYLVSNLVHLLHRAIFRHKAAACLSGLAMIGINMMFAFPTRMIQCVLLIIFFMAYCQKVIDYGK